MNKVHFVALTCALTLLGASSGAKAEDFSCPPPSAINCVPATKTIGDWQDNGGQKTGNTFAANNQCGNIFNLPNGGKRLLCCYTNCGVFYRDVQAIVPPPKPPNCTKQSESQFVCN